MCVQFSSLTLFRAPALSAAASANDDAEQRAERDDEQTHARMELTRHDGQSLFELCARLAMTHGVGSSRQAVSQHLAVLESAGLVSSERVGRTKIHHLHTEPLREIAERWPTPTKE